LPSSLLGYPDYGALVVGRGNYFQFDLVFIKKSNQTEFFLKKTKTGSTGLVQFFQVFSVWF
jgi:hypothetical protein